jgi:hypothetical protein
MARPCPSAAGLKLLQKNRRRWKTWTVESRASVWDSVKTHFCPVQKNFASLRLCAFALKITPAKPEPNHAVELLTSERSPA